MEDIQIKQIGDLLKYEVNHLVQESKEEGFNFLIKLINEYESKRNTFSKTGECLYGIFRGDTLIGIGGLNQDPYTKDNKIGRLRRFYIAKDYRRKLSDAKIYFTIVVLHTDTEQGDKFYTSSGFAKGKMYVGTSHYLNLDKRM
ncbi:GNAT family N-acetyltransferase [Bacillus mycoides]|uniref:GNAT family N-acetyltransferase n=1 Tax=Bacillus cereus group TaxID=86661 RepID=UPI0018A128EB|nr:GNAT family N-acetyltransferase [Bacillus cereus]